MTDGWGFLLYALMIAMFISSAICNLIGIVVLYSYRTMINKYFLYGSIIGVIVSCILTTIIHILGDIIRNRFWGIMKYIHAPKIVLAWAVLLSPMWITMLIIFFKNKKANLYNLHIYKSFIFGLLLYAILPLIAFGITYGYFI